MAKNKFQSLLLMVMLFLISVTGILAFFRMNPRSLDVVLSLTQGLRMRVEGDSLSSDSKITVYANPKSIILPIRNARSTTRIHIAWLNSL